MGSEMCIRDSSKAALEMVYGSVRESIGHKAAYIDPSLAQFYYLGQIDNAISLEEYLDGTVIGRLSSEEWFGNIKTMNHAGLLRERLYLRVEEAVIALLISNLRESTNMSMALSLSNKNNIDFVP